MNGGMIRLSSEDKTTLANRAQLPLELVARLLAHLDEQNFILTNEDAIAPASERTRSFIEAGWRRAQEQGQRHQTSDTVKRKRKR